MLSFIEKKLIFCLLLCILLGAGNACSESRRIKWDEPNKIYPGDAPEIKALNSLLESLNYSKKFETAEDWQNIDIINKNPAPVVPFLAAALSKIRKELRPRELRVIAIMNIREKIVLDIIKDYPNEKILVNEKAEPLLSMLIGMDSKEGIAIVLNGIESAKELSEYGWVRLILSCNKKNGMRMVSELQKTSKSAWTKDPGIVSTLEKYRKNPKSVYNYYAKDADEPENETGEGMDDKKDSPEIKAFKYLCKSYEMYGHFDVDGVEDAYKTINNNPAPVIPLLVKAFAFDRKNPRPTEFYVLSLLDIHEKVVLDIIASYPKDKLVHNENYLVLLCNLAAYDSEKGLKILFNAVEKLPESDAIEWIKFIISINKKNGMRMVSELQKTSKSAWTKDPGIVSTLEKYRKDPKSVYNYNAKDADEPENETGEGMKAEFMSKKMEGEPDERNKQSATQYPGKEPEIKALNLLLSVAAVSAKRLYTDKSCREARRVIINNPEPVIPLLVKSLSKDRKEIRPLETFIIGAIRSSGEDGQKIAERILLEALKDYPKGLCENKIQDKKQPLIYGLISLDLPNGINYVTKEFKLLPEPHATTLAIEIVSWNMQNGMNALSELHKTSKSAWTKSPMIIAKLEKYRENPKSVNNYNAKDAKEPANDAGEGMDDKKDLPEIKAYKFLLESFKKSSNPDFEGLGEALHTINNNPKPIIPLLVKALAFDRKNPLPKELSIVSFLEFREQIILDVLSGYPKNNLVGNENSIVLFYQLVSYDSRKGLQIFLNEIEKLPESEAIRWIKFIISSNKKNGMRMVSELQKASKSSWTKDTEIISALEKYRKDPKSVYNYNAKDDEEPENESGAGMKSKADLAEFKAYKHLLQSFKTSSKLKYEGDIEAIQVINNNPEPIVPLIIKALSCDRETQRPKELNILAWLKGREKILLDILRTYPKENLIRNKNAQPLFALLISMDSKKGLEMVFNEMGNLSDTEAAGYIRFILSCYGPNGFRMVSELQKISKSDWTNDLDILSALEEYKKTPKLLDNYNAKDDEDPESKPAKAPIEVADNTNQAGENHVPNDNNKIGMPCEQRTSSMPYLIGGIIAGMLVLLGIIYLAYKRRHES